MAETLYFSMAEASRRTSVAPATLRKWAARYDIDASHRSAGGHRLYSETDLERLRLVSQLKSRGWALADLANLDIAELRSMNPLDTKADLPGSVSFCGIRVVSDFASWFGPRARILEEVDVSLATGVLVWEVGSLSDQHVTRAQRLTRSGVPVLLVYHYALNRRLQQLAAQGIESVSGPLTWSTLMRWLLGQSPQSSFSDAELVHWANTQPELECECPRHVATILIQLREFAKYSQQCSLDSPAQGELHQRLFHWTQAAQLPLEEALRAVIEEES
ncbi:MerR family transcriptional regulator [Salinispirillum sp. LH 10-3-1]|uniref:MerR family transcriptional regulator n=1 Tax=Salinispirillum sp. LH 10-3-1 TaxID=2952525 RepID=A0AB38YIW5_9GAMM